MTNHGVHEFAADFDNVNKAGTGGDPIYDNQGSLRKEGGTSSTTVTSGVAFSNTGIVEVQTGTLTISNSALPQLSTNVLTDGVWRVGADSTLGLFSGSSILEVGSASTVELLGPNAMFTPLADVATNSGTWLISGSRPSAH